MRTATKPQVSEPAALEQEVRERALKGQVNVPAYPAVALKLRRTIADGNFGANDLARVVGADETLAATVLRLANSGFFRGFSRVSSLAEAVGRIGADELSRLALAASLAASVQSAGSLAELRRAVWRQSLAAGLCAQALAPARHIEPHTAFLSGLLHDFGRVVAIAALEHAGAATRLTEPEWLAMVDRLHVQLGTLVASRWGLPEALVCVMNSHHRPEAAGVYRPLVDLVTTADAVVAAAENCPYLLERDLAAIPGVTGEWEIDALMRMVPAIPAYIGSLDDVTESSAARAVASSVEKPPSTLGEPRTDADFPVNWVRSNTTLPYRARFVTPGGIAMFGRTAMFEGSVVRLRVERDGQAVDLSGRVSLCVEESRGYLVEVRLFALPGASRDWWDALAQQIGAPAAAG